MPLSILRKVGTLTFLDRYSLYVALRKVLIWLPLRAVALDAEPESTLGLSASHLKQSDRVY
jgi:hypothetical protein